MKIECMLKRLHGSKITIGKSTYHFKPKSGFKPDGTPVDDDEPHVAEVADKAHIKRFLSIMEAYCQEGKRPEPDEESESSADEGGDDASGDELASMSDTDLRELVTQKTGKAPHPNTGRDKLIALLQAAA